jgi:allantoin racemase
MVINPNSSPEMTKQIERVLLGIKRPETLLSVVRVEDAPPAIETDVDAAQAVPGVLRLVRKANEEGYDVVIIACFSDPGLGAAREISKILVLGIQETSLHIAAMLGHRFTVLTPLPHRVPKKERDVRGLGLGEALASVRALGLTVTETEAEPERTKARILDVARAAVEEDGAEVLVLGCAGMAGYASEIEKKLGIVVIDPVTVTFKVAEGLAEMGLRHSKRALYRMPSKV